MEDQPECRLVPSKQWPNIVTAVADARDGTLVQVLPGHVETLDAPLVLDSNVCIEGPAQGSARVFGQESIVVAAGKAKDAVFIRHLKLHIQGGPALVIAGACTVDHCTFEGADVGIEVAAHAGRVVRIQDCFIHECRVGVSLAGGSEAVLEGTRVQTCNRGVVVTGLAICEGWNQQLGSLALATFISNSEANLVLRALSIFEHGRQLVAECEVVLSGWPHEIFSPVVPLGDGAAVLHFNGANVNATVFEEGGDAASGSQTQSSCSSPNKSFEAWLPGSMNLGEQQ